MDPLSKNKRRAYFVILFIVFIISAPFFIFDAKGYRFNLKDYFKIYETGGLYISTDQSGIEIYVNSELVRKTNIVQKSIFVQDLKPSTYEISVSKEGLQSWRKTLRVFPELVTEARPFLMKSKLTLTEISRFLDSGGNAVGTSSEKIQTKNSDYDLVNTLFLAPTSKSVSVATSTKSATTSANSKSVRKLSVKNEGGRLRVSWTGEIDSIPSYFCDGTICKSEIFINNANNIKSFDFFPGRDDLLIVRLPDGIYVTEIDDRSPQNIQKIISGAGFDFRVRDGSELYFKDGIKLYSVSL
ncbi:MAG: PEGA domain-containing protein [bacterium]|nr:PEGA domain-containing protein [bacterium]